MCSSDPVSIAWPGVAAEIKRESAHRFVLTPASDRLDLCCGFQRAGHSAAGPAATFAAAEKHWSSFWNSGAAVDLSAAPDPRARELERRIVLSQYLTAIQCAGSMPPQETGLTCNSWFGKFHLEMHYWHAAHFASWGRPALLERSLGWYMAILPSAREKAKKTKITTNLKPCSALAEFQEPSPGQYWYRIFRVSRYATNRSDNSCSS